MNTTLENVNEIMIVKNELNNILDIVGGDNSVKFSYYAYQFSYVLSQMEEKTDEIIG